MSKKGRVFSGARPTGRQHLGNYLGAIKNYVALQDDYDCVYCIVDLHALPTLPTFKDMVRQHPDNVNYGLVGYPVLMTADIVLYKSNIVPVGIDQAPHLEYARETVRSFNHRYNTNVLIEPEMKNTEIPLVLGIAGERKMSKSLNNHIEIAATPEET